MWALFSSLSKVRKLEWYEESIRRKLSFLNVKNTNKHAYSLLLVFFIKRCKFFLKYAISTSVLSAFGICIHCIIFLTPLLDSIVLVRKDSDVSFISIFVYVHNKRQFGRYMDYLQIVIKKEILIKTYQNLEPRGCLDVDEGVYGNGRFMQCLRNLIFIVFLLMYLLGKASEKLAVMLKLEISKGATRVWDFFQNFLLPGYLRR